MSTAPFPCPTSPVSGRIRRAASSVSLELLQFYVGSSHTAVRRKDRGSEAKRCFADPVHPANGVVPIHLGKRKEKVSRLAARFSADKKWLKQT